MIIDSTFVFSQSGPSTKGEVQWVTKYLTDGIPTTSPQKNETVSSYIVDDKHIFVASAVVKVISGIQGTIAPPLILSNSTSTYEINSLIDEYGCAHYVFAAPYSEQDYKYQINRIQDTQTGEWLGVESEIHIDPNPSSIFKSNKITLTESGLTPILINSLPYTIYAQITQDFIPAEAKLSLISSENVFTIKGEITGDKIKFVIQNIPDGGYYVLPAAYSTINNTHTFSEMGKIVVSAGQPHIPPTSILFSWLYRISEGYGTKVDAILEQKAIKLVSGQEISLNKLTVDPQKQFWNFKVKVDADVTLPVILTAYDENNNSLYQDKKIINFKPEHYKELNFSITQKKTPFDKIAYIRGQIGDPSQSQIEYIFKLDTKENIDALLPDGIGLPIGTGVGLILPAPYNIDVWVGKEVVIDFKHTKMGTSVHYIPVKPLVNPSPMRWILTGDIEEIVIEDLIRIGEKEW